MSAENKDGIMFRAFDKSTGTMYLSPEEIKHLGMWFDAHLPGTLANINNIEITQYIGIKDKNGQKVYRGDFIKTHTGRIYEVKRSKKYMEFHFESLAGNKHFLTLFSLTDKGSFEVIGNKYEHPELLNNITNAQECDATEGE